MGPLLVVFFLHPLTIKLEGPVNPALLVALKSFTIGLRFVG